LKFEKNMPELLTSQSFFWLALGTSILAVAGFISWVLFEVARLIRQSNQIVEHGREVAEGIEKDIAGMRERFGGFFGSLLGVLKSVQTVSDFVNRKTKEKEAMRGDKKRKRYNSLLDEEEKTE
jgi:hypothetical protein